MHSCLKPSLEDEIDVGDWRIRPREFVVWMLTDAGISTYSFWEMSIRLCDVYVCMYVCR